MNFRHNIIVFMLHLNIYVFSVYRILPNPNYKVRTIVIAIVSVFSVALFICLAYLGYRLWRRSKKVSVDSKIYKSLGRLSWISRTLMNTGNMTNVRWSGMINKMKDIFSAKEKGKMKVLVAISSSDHAHLFPRREAYHKESRQR